ncbi:F0F1 ATP synthase subunit A [Sphingomonas nostoxanthinifaciens]|uniref:F0F1 ATP synthase subunit A n=1 Tax=Sphingomonas nostoxanthinifaciens TaxID=2872652 RepID=UPI001CC1CE1B|nr:F0F1 ATP synthase subunit A [Sphingomonas nostoxanthinifaciens]UAK23530.1 F0F1 ATP synthase subunit A [Sphingomonas nostoxanthinifaciens]
MAAEGSGIDPMHQFQVEPVLGRHLMLGGYDISFTNSALFMVLTMAVLWVFMLGGMKRSLVPGRWQAAVEGVTSFVDNMMTSSIGPKGRHFTPYVFSLFMFILFANFIGLFPLGIVPGWHPFTVTSHITVTAVLAFFSFSIVLIVGFLKHGFHFFSLFIPHGTPKLMIPLIFVIELASFLVRPFSLGLRLFVAMTAGHILLDVFASFIVQGIHAGGPLGPVVAILSFVMIVGISALELLVAAIQAYVFALLTSLYLNDAINLH